MEQISKAFDGNAFMSTGTLAIIAVTCAVYLFYTSYVIPLKLFSKSGIKGPPPTLIVGNLSEFRKGLHDSLVNNRQKYGKVFGTFLGTQPTLWVGDVDILKIIMVKEFHQFPDREALTKTLPYPIKHSVLFARGEDWKRIRSILTATFSASKLKQIFYIVESACNRCVEKLEALSENEEIADMKVIYGNLTMEVIVASAFGVQLENDPRASKLINYANKIFNSVPTIQFIVALIPSFQPFLRFFLRERQESTTYIANTVKGIIRERRESLKNGTRCNRDLLQLMIEASEDGKMSDDEIVGQAYIFLIAGYETTANTLTYATYLLANHPEVQDKLYKEIDKTYQDKGVIDYESVSELQYLDMVLSETLRIYPPAHVVNRGVSKDVTINGVKLLKSVPVGIPIYGIHHDPDYWPNPEQFRPERFTPEEKQARNPSCYMPFGMGPRNCIGMRLALIEAKLALAKVVKAVEFSAIDKTEIPLKLKAGGTLSPANPVYVGIKKRL
ncbi:Cytochrome P450 3A24 [Trichoplax sp. H2]|nr:Cytochrome P450 3A24 [Trichoplax sp. H2]|eukprot:RDD37121.1 Cytochrome P450 3A24 [Trichoplax sp. H2]